MTEHMHTPEIQGDAPWAAQPFAAWNRHVLETVESGLDRWVGRDAPSPLKEAMRYAVLDGGKRLRPLLVYAAGEAVQGHAGAMLRAACAVELIHAYSLVHDDMPCMDNDVLRRGKPTVHVQFGEAVALLAGDALQALAFELLAPPPSEDDMPVEMQAQFCRQLARAAGGVTGMAGGQAIDLASVGKRLTAPELQHMHELKTGALLRACVRMGAVCGAEVEDRAQEALAEYGSAMGLAFQVVDDILDVVADSQTLGKTAGKDAAQDKPTYVSLIGLDASRAFARDLHDHALTALQSSGLSNTARLKALADLMIDRAF